MLSRQQYDASLSQLGQSISSLKQQLTVLQLQNRISRLFAELNESSTKETCIPQGVFADNVSKSNAFFNCEEGSEVEITVHRGGSHYWADVPEGWTCYFIENELEQLCKDAEWKDDWCKIKMKSCKITPSWFFAGCEPAKDEQVISVIDVSAKETTPESTETVSVVQEEPAVSVATN